jgi:hypothetical protein
MQLSLNTAGCNLVAEISTHLGRRLALTPTELLATKVHKARQLGNSLPSACHDVLESLDSAIDEGNSFDDPEVFLSLYVFLRPDLSPTVKETYARLCAVHAKLADAAEVFAIGLSYLRLTHSFGTIFDLRSTPTTRGELLKRDVVTRRAIIYSTEKLFEDLLPGRSSDFVDLSSHQRREAEKNLQHSESLLGQYLGAAFADFISVIRTVSIVGPLRVRHSFSCRTAYFGALFIDPFNRPILGIIEDLMHEYYHQRLWAWWDLCDRYALPPDNVRITLSTMAQAMVIYSSALMLLDSVRQAPEAEVAYSVRRRRFIRERLPCLIKAVEQAGRPYPILLGLRDVALSALKGSSPC